MILATALLVVGLSKAPAPQPAGFVCDPIDPSCSIKRYVPDDCVHARVWRGRTGVTCWGNGPEPQMGNSRHGVRVR